METAVDSAASIEQDTPPDQSTNNPSADNSNSDKKPDSELLEKPDSELNQSKCNCPQPVKDVLLDDKLEEDIPEDFFDDFLKEDFMAGLDIVDEDDEKESLKKVEEDKMPAKPKQKAVKEKRKKIDHVKKFKESPPGFTGREQKFLKKQMLHMKEQELRDEREELRRLDQELEEIRLFPGKVKPLRKADEGYDTFDIRRDPEKTRQAIQKDKIKSAKDKEKKLITDIVETGLVPPGMELEVDMDDVHGEETEVITDLREKIRGTKQQKTPESKVITSRRKSGLTTKTSPVKRTRSASSHKSEEKGSSAKSSKIASRKSPKKDERGSPLRRRSPLLRSRSPLPLRNYPNRRSPIYRRSPLLTSRLSRSPIRRRRSRSPFIPSRSWRRSSSNSPRRRSPRIRSSRSNSRDRSTSYRRYRRDRSSSPRRRRRSRSRSPRPRKEEKMSFLEELVAKLNETHHTTPAMVKPGFPAGSFLTASSMVMQQPLAPQPVFFNQAPAPVPFMESQILLPQSSPMIQPQPQLGPSIQPQLRPTVPPHPRPTVPPQHVSVQPNIQQARLSEDLYDESFFIGNDVVLPQAKRTPPTARSIPVGSSKINGTPEIDNKSSNRNATKLFEDKKINLSDFLSLTAKPQVSNTSSTKLQEKVKVIQRCQDAIKLLTGRRSSGPLIVHKMNTYQAPKDKTISPLLRMPPMDLPFTTPGAKSVLNDTSFKKCCETLLYQVGIEKSLQSTVEEKKSLIIPPETEVVLRDFVTTFSNPSSDLFPIAKSVPTKTFGTQTDKDLIRCMECLRRKGILYAQVGVQAGGEGVLNFSVSTQVTEADFYSMIPKNQSLASLTPAQLLGKQSMISDQLKSLSSVNMDQLRASVNRINSQGRYIPSPPPAPLMSFQNPQPPEVSESSYPPSLFGQQTFASNVQQRSPVRPHYPQQSNQRRGSFKRF